MISQTTLIVRAARRIARNRGGWLSLPAAAARGAVGLVQTYGLLGMFRTVADRVRLHCFVPARDHAPLREQLAPQQAGELLARCPRQPLISIIVPVYNVAPKWLDRCIESVRAQYYPHWELVLVDDASPSRAIARRIQRWTARDGRIKARLLETNTGIVGATNIGLELAQGEFSGFLDHDDELTPDALTWVVKALNEHPDAVWFYSDEDKLNPKGRCCEPAFKPDYSPEYLFSAMYTCHLSVYATSLLRQAGGLRAGFDGSQDHDLALRLSEMVRRDQVVHIPRILYHWRMLPNSTAGGDASVKPYAAVAGRAAVQEALMRRGLKGDVQFGAVWPTLYEVRLQPTRFPKVTVIISGEGARSALQKCINSIRQHTRYPNYHLLILDNQPNGMARRACVERERQAGLFDVLQYDRATNHSAMLNHAVAAVDSEFVVFLHRDVELLSENWLETLVATADIDASIAGVGAKLLYPDGTVQHGGIVLGINESVGHAHVHLADSSPGYCGRAHALNEVFGATAALLLMKRAAFLEVGGFNAERYPDSLNDADLWLKLREAGYRCLYNPLVRATHSESKSQWGNANRDEQAALQLIDDWADKLTRDPYYNPNLSLRDLPFNGRRAHPLPAELRRPGAPEMEDEWETGTAASIWIARGQRLFTHFRNETLRRGLLAAVIKSLRFLVRRLCQAVRSRVLPSQVSSASETVAASALATPAMWSDPKAMTSHLARISLEAFLSTGATLTFPKAEAPVVTVIVLLYNRAELSFNCLNSLLACRSVPFELILVDNASSDRTPELVSRLRHVRAIRNEENVGFGPAVNQAARLAAGKYLLLLNNDGQVLGNSIEVATRFLNENVDVGAVGGKILLLDGALQEAGSIVWRDGSALGYGRGDDPERPCYAFQRDVDFCSGAFLMTRRELFLRHGGFDRAYDPAYYEDVDYCVGLHREGWRVVYHPQIALLHFESASSASPEKAQKLMRERQAIFARKHGSWLAEQFDNSPENILAARTARRDAPRVLFMDDFVPNPAIGAGVPRAHRILHDLVGLGCAVTFYARNSPVESWDEIYRIVPRQTEIIRDAGPERLTEFLTNRRGCFDLVFVSRPTNAACIRDACDAVPGLLDEVQVIYDAEAIFCLRDARRGDVLGNPVPPAEQTAALQLELSLAARWDCVVSVSPHEAMHFESYCPNVHVLGHAVEAQPLCDDFHNRGGLLFVGPIRDLYAPNTDSMHWLLRDIMPQVQARLSVPFPLTQAGEWYDDSLDPTMYDCPLARLGRVDDLAPVYARARVFVAPTRYAAGIPLKLLDAAAHGVPIVATSLLAEQLGWRHEQELLVADTTEAFAEACLRLHSDQALWERIRSNALRTLQRDCSPEAFRRQLQRIIVETLTPTFRFAPLTTPVPAAQCSAA